MIVRYWHPFQEVETLRRQLDRVFDEVTNTADVTPVHWTPAVRLVEAGDNYVLTAQLAGVTADNLDIQVTRDAIAIAGDRPQPETDDTVNVLHDDVRYGSFRRVVTLPEAIRNDAVEANFTDGVLTLTLPKVEEVRNKVVKVSLGQPNAIPNLDAESATETMTEN